MLYNKRFMAFTLAEVLITLGIIGIVAAMTIPTLMQSSQYSEYVAGVKKSLSVLSQAVSQYELDNGCVGDLSQCNDFSIADAATQWNALKPYLRLNQDCGTTSGCFPTTKYVPLFGPPGVNDLNTITYANGILSDGTIIGLVPGLCVSNPNGYCAAIYIDVNGSKAPNKIGRDLFKFDVLGNKVVPTEPTSLYTSSGDYCGPTAGGRNIIGWFCAKRIMLEGAMNY